MGCVVGFEVARKVNFDVSLAESFETDSNLGY